MFKQTTHTAHETKEIPKEPHFAILVERSFTYDDGYGERGIPSTSTARSLDYVVCMTQEDLSAWVMENDKPKYGSPPVYTVIRVNPVRVVKEVRFQFEDS